MAGEVSPGSALGRIALLLDRSPEAAEPLAQALFRQAKDLRRGCGEDLTPAELIAAAEVLDVPVTYLAGMSSADRDLGVSLRLGQLSDSEAPAEALRYADMLLRYLHLLDLWLGPRHSDLDGLDPDYSRMHIKAGRRTAGKVRDALMLSDNPIIDLVQLIEDCGIPVAFLSLPETIHGLNVRDERSGYGARVIIVNCNDYWTRQRFTLAHELAHALYNDDGQVIVDTIGEPDYLPERRADTFARHLLLPEAAMKKEVLAARETGIPANIFVPRLMLSFGVSREVVLRALVDDGLVERSDPRLPALESEPVSRQMEKAGYGAKWQELCEVQHEPSGSPWLTERAVEAYGRGLVDVSVVAEIMGEDQEVVAEQLAAAGWTS